MKKILLLLIFFFPIYALSATPADCKIDPSNPKSADQFLITCGAGSIGINPLSEDYGSAGTKRFIAKIANGLISLGSLLAVGAIVWSGIQYTKAYGDDENLKKAKTTGIYALIGLVLLLASFGLVDMFIRFIYMIAGAT